MKFKKINNFLYKILLLFVFKKTSYQDIIIDEKDFIIITIAFNNSDIIKLQNEYLSKNLLDSFTYIVADNSNNLKVSEDILSFCKKNSISYIKIPHNIISKFRSSASHGMSLNWCYYNLIKKYKPKYFGLLDHDIFPIKKTNIISEIKNGFYGVIRKRNGGHWYLWPGFSFFEYQKVKNYTFNFFPYHAKWDGSLFLDTGGSNYPTIFKKIQTKDIGVAESLLVDLNTKEPLIKGQDSSQTIEIIGDAWLHVRQISWRRETSDKIKNIEDILIFVQEYLKSKFL